VWKNAKLIHSNIWNPDKDVIAWLENRLSLSGFKPKTGNHIETRTGCLNFSIVGRNASLSNRYAYIDWDIKHSERESIAVEFNHTFLELEARLGGETGIDIYPKGYDKSQIIKYFSTVDRIMFFGDKMNPGGNDYPLKSAIENNRLGECFPVKDWKHTYKILSVMKVSI
jgi:phosphomannomutase